MQQCHSFSSRRQLLPLGALAGTGEQEAARRYRRTSRLTLGSPGGGRAAPSSPSSSSGSSARRLGTLLLLQAREPVRRTATAGTIGTRLLAQQMRQDVTGQPRTRALLLARATSAEFPRVTESRPQQSTLQAMVPARRRRRRQQQQQQCSATGAGTVDFGAWQEHVQPQQPQQYQQNHQQEPKEQHQESNQTQQRQRRRRRRQSSSSSSSDSPALEGTALDASMVSTVSVEPQRRRRPLSSRSRPSHQQLPREESAAAQ